LNWDIVDVMSTVKELMPSPAGTVAEADVDGGADVDDGADEDGGADEDDEQPAAIRAATAATATQPNREMGLFLLPSSIQYTFRRSARGYAGHHRTHVSSAMKRRRCGD
jgi:hypothetical protein